MPSINRFRRVFADGLRSRHNRRGKWIPDASGYGTQGAVDTGIDQWAGFRKGFAKYGNIAAENGGPRYRGKLSRGRHRIRARASPGPRIRAFDWRTKRNNGIRQRRDRSPAVALRKPIGRGCGLPDGRQFDRFKCVLMGS